MLKHAPRCRQRGQGHAAPAAAWAGPPTCLMTTMRSGLGTRISYSSCCRVRRFQRGGRLQPAKPVSKLRSAFWKLSCTLQTRPSTTAVDSAAECCARRCRQACTGAPNMAPVTRPFSDVEGHSALSLLSESICLCSSRKQTGHMYTTPSLRSHGLSALVVSSHLEGAAHSHGFPHTLHLGCQLRLGSRELFKCKAGNLRHAILAVNALQCCTRLTYGARLCMLPWSHACCTGDVCKRMHVQQAGEWL